MSEIPFAAEIVAEARAWVGTPFAHLHSHKGIATDCAGLIVGVGRSVGLLPEGFQLEAYSPVPDGERMKATCDRHLIPIDQPRFGAIVLVAWGANLPPQHLGIVADYQLRVGFPSIIHAQSRGRRKEVVEQRLEFSRAMHLVQAYRYPTI